MSTTSLLYPTLAIATERDRQAIYQIRHAVYAQELQQHPENKQLLLKDELDLSNHFIVAKYNKEIGGFISITTPASNHFSVDKYFPRTAIPHLFDEHLFEIRLLTVVKNSRHTSLALALMFAAFRWVQSHGGKYIVAICRADLMSMYLKAGLQPLGKSAVSGHVRYELAVASIEDMQSGIDQNKQGFEALQKRIGWQLPYAFFAPSACYHGGSFFKAIGEDLQSLQAAKTVINADVLDAHFPPSPQVVNAVGEHLSWLLQTSPPTHAEGLVQKIAAVRKIPTACILPGAGSSNLIFLALRSFLNKSSRVLIIDPCYGEYIHVLEKVIQCRVTRFVLKREEGFVIDTHLLLQQIGQDYDMVILVNPNSPTGVHVKRKTLETMLEQVSPSTLVWIDETYVEYAGATETLEPFAVKRENVIVCKSMSKVYALSGARSAYLCASPHLIETLKSLTPPWSVSLPAQVAAIAALNDPGYYNEKYEATHRLRQQLKRQLVRLGISEIIEGVANFLLFYLPLHIKPGAFLKRCEKESLYLRDVSNMGSCLGANAIRIAVKDEATNDRMIRIMEKALKESEMFFMQPSVLSSQEVTGSSI